MIRDPDNSVYSTMYIDAVLYLVRASGVCLCVYLEWLFFSWDPRQACVGSNLWMTGTSERVDCTCLSFISYVHVLCSEFYDSGKVL